MVTLVEIKKAIEEIEYACGDVPLLYLEEALDLLTTAYGAMNTVSVCGRDNIDSLLGCMIGLEMIIGEKKEVDEDG